jgi:hypothetical protein
MAATFPNGIIVHSALTFTGTISPIARSVLQQDNLKQFAVPLTNMRVWDNMAALLPTAGATDDLGIIEGTFGTASPVLQTEDLKAESGNPTLNYARFQCPIPMEYVDGETFLIRLHAQMVTTIADDTATLDVEAYLVDEEGGIGSDICATAAISINTLTGADYDFTITPATLVAGGMLDVRLKTTVSDAATATPVIAEIGSVQILCDVKG